MMLWRSSVNSVSGSQSPSLVTSVQETEDDAALFRELSENVGAMDPTQLESRAEDDVAVIIADEVDCGCAVNGGDLVQVRMHWWSARKQSRSSVQLYHRTKLGGMSFFLKVVVG